MVKDALYFLIPLAAALMTALVLGWTLAAAAILVLALFVAFFFRDPDRQAPPDPAIIVSPADGRVVRIDRVGNETRVSIFLSIFNVHVNRSPMAGKISRIEYRKGSFRAAFDHRASVDNEQNTLTVEGEGRTLRFSQIAGLVARRIVCWKAPGDRVGRGERIGLIRFGSRVDIWIPEGMDLMVGRGDRVRGGATGIARVRNT